MKKLFILSAIAVGGLIANKANAQLSIHVGFNVPVHRVYAPSPPPVVIEEQPVYNDDYGQVNYNDASDDYYYLPEVEAYYSVSNHYYYYNNGRNWVTCAYLPGAYRNYDWRTATRYEVRGNRPYMHHDVYRQRWGGYSGDRSNWGRRFERRHDGGYAYQNRDNRNNNRGWDRGRDNNRDRGNWGGRPDNRGDHGNWGGRPNNNNNNGGGNHGGQDHGNQNQGGHDRGNNGNGQDHGNRGGGRDFAANRGGFGIRR
jgi:hypothetical protein